MLNWDDYNESEKIQKPQQIKEAQQGSTEQKVETAEENISEYSPVEAGERAKQAQEAIDELDTKQGEEELEGLAASKRTIRDNNNEYTMSDGRKIFLLADGRLVNLAAAEGHPSEVMDMSFANQYLALCRLAKEGKDMQPIVYDITTEQDQGLATTKLATLGFDIDSLTHEQVVYLDDYNAGT